MAQNPTPFPAKGMDGMAQLSEPLPVTFGTDTMIRPCCIGSILFSTLPLYLPKYWVMELPPV